MDNSVDQHRETPVENPVKPHATAEKTPTNDATYVASTTQMWDNRRVNKNGDESATNTTHRLNHSNEQAEEGLGMIVSKIPDWIENRDIAIQFLEFADKDYRNAKSMRVFYAIAANRHGVTHREIADIYGMSESGVQMMIKRAGEQS